MSHKSAYDIPVQLLVRIGDFEPTPLGSSRLPWPHDIHQELPRMLREAAEAIEKEAS